jgi:hypothetical protein
MQPANSLIPRVKTISSGTPVDSLFAEFPDLTHPAEIQRELCHTTIQHIRTISGRPVACQTD